MPLGTRPAADDESLGAVFFNLNTLWTTVGHGQDEKGNPVKYPTDEELDNLADLLAKASKAIAAEKKARS